MKKPTQDLFVDFADKVSSANFEPADDGMEDREILFRIWTKFTEQDGDFLLERAPDYSILIERYPDQEAWTVLYLYRRIEEVEISGSFAVSELLKQIEAVSKFQDDRLRKLSTSLAVILSSRLADSKSTEAKLVREFLLRLVTVDEAKEKESLRQLDQLEKETLVWAHQSTLDGNRLGILKPAPRAYADMSYDELSRLLEDAVVVDYRVDCQVIVGNGLRHGRFGLGYVIKVEPQKAIVLFSDLTRVLKVR